MWLGGRCRACQAKFSFRYFLVELLTGSVFAGLYWWEIGQLGLYPASLAAQLQPLALHPQMVNVLHAQYLSHITLFSFMIVASMIDIDYQIIPDEATIPGTLIALIIAAAYPWSLLPNWQSVFVMMPPPGRMVLDPEPFRVLSNSFDNYPARLAGLRNPQALAVALGCLWVWCIALLPRRFRIRRRWNIGWLLFWRGLFSYKLIHIIAVVGGLAITAFWWWVPAEMHWQGLLTALLGMAWGCGLLWVVRVVCGVSLGKEAMGFGDVVLVAMMGAFLGWQPVLILFFVAPFYGLVIGLFTWFFHGESRIPYGPYLCLGAATVLIRWEGFWQYSRNLFYYLNALLPLFIIASTGIMALLLLMLRVVRLFTQRGEVDEDEEVEIKAEK